MNTLYVYTHLGLGDIILCNGLIRNLCKKYAHITIFCKPKYFASISYMLRDIQNLEILAYDDAEVNSFLQDKPKDKIYYVGHMHIPNFIQECTFDECFYKQIGLNFQRRWEDFYIERNCELENELFDLQAPKEPYAFVHDDYLRGFCIDETYIDKKLKVFRPSLVDNIFSYCKIIEQASEIHCMDSSFKHIVDSLPIKHDKLFYHLYVRGTNNYAFTQSRLNWKKII